MIDRFLNILQAATAQVSQPFFQLPVAGQEDPIYRERVYCYELYHQMRTLLEALAEADPLREFVLNAEIDKQGHLFIEPHMPDFVFHVPGTMEHNLVVVEVKPVTAAADKIQKDIRTLEHFVSDRGRYSLGVELVYGDRNDEFGKFEVAFREVANVNFQLFRHRRPGEPATMVYPPENPPR